jgi:hypothetical protein
LPRFVEVRFDKVEADSIIRWPGASMTILEWWFKK